MRFCRSDPVRKLNCHAADVLRDIQLTYTPSSIRPDQPWLHTGHRTWHQACRFARIPYARRRHQFGGRAGDVPMKRWAFFSGVCALLSMGVVQTTCGCGPSPGAADAAVEGPPDAAGDAGTDVKIAYPDRDAVGDEPPPALGCPLPGFYRDNTYSAFSGLCSPIDKKYMPPPIEWEPCPASSPIQAGCRIMKINWNWKTNYSLPGIINAYGVDSKGKPILAYSRYTPAGSLRLAGALRCAVIAN
jgi:hypothetical protein